nr:integrase, catalytic region, zinc finger, CCHC-type, peptidase aspartic, catalytic [Tanacetum cinerariifolium]
MTGNLKLLCNFVEKFLGTIRFGNDQFAPILGYGYLVYGNVTINRVYYVESLNHDLFSVDANVPSQQELNLLFGPLYGEFFNGGSTPSTNIQSTFAPSTQTNVHAEENNNDQAEEDPEMCMFALTVSTAKPKNIKEAMADSAWIEAMQEE